jgi:hypothetical protein
MCFQFGGVKIYMTNSVKFYAIRIVGTNYFKSSKWLDFGDYETAMAAGVFYNQLKTAEKAIRNAAKFLAHEGAEYSICWEWYTPDAQHAQREAQRKSRKLPNRKPQFRALQLEIVELELRILDRFSGSKSA